MIRSAIDPLNPKEFDERKAQHLLQRSGFGGNEKQIKVLANIGLEKAVDYIVEFKDLPDQSPVELDAFDKDIMRPATQSERQTFRKVRESGDESQLEILRTERQRRQRADRQQIAEMEQWWFKRIVESSRPLEEKMTLFWHGHFATGYRTIEDLHKLIMRDALEESQEIIRVTIGEYLPDTIDLGDGKVAERDETTWDYKGVVDWAKAAWDSDLTLSEATQLGREEIVNRIAIDAENKIKSINLAPIDPYLVPSHAQQELATWVSSKFNMKCKANEFDNLEIEEAIDFVMGRALEVYKKREQTYPIDFIIELTGARMQQEPAQAIEIFCKWVKVKYDLDWTPQTLPSNNPQELHSFLIEESERWDDERIERRADRMIEEANGDLDSWLRENWQFALTGSEKETFEEDPQLVAIQKIKQVQRAELAQLERTVLLQIFDSVWKEHLYQMDQAKESIGFRSFSQLDPRIEYKREGARLFDEMFEHMQDRVTDLVFKAKMQVRVQPPQEEQQQPSGQQQQAPAQTPQRQQMPKPKVAEQSVRAAASAGGTMTVGRNEPCPCGSGKKYKKCCGKK